jgi:hypothetical protein
MPAASLAAGDAPPGGGGKPWTVRHLPPGTVTAGLGLAGRNWTLVLRRRPARIVQGVPEGRYSDAYELICCGCGDDPDLDFREVSPRLRRVRGPYRMAAGIAAYGRHIRLYHVGPVTWAERTGGATR